MSSPSPFQGSELEKGTQREFRRYSLKRGQREGVENWTLIRHPQVSVQSTRTSLPPHISRRLGLQPTHSLLWLDEEHERDKGAKEWTSRAHRKQRYKTHTPRTGQPRHTRSDDILLRVGRMSRLEVWNISWWVAQAFTWGSVVWVVNGFASFLPFVTPIQAGAMMPIQGWTAFIGATIFEAGSVVGILEAWNRDDTIHFGWGVEKTLESATRPLRGHHDGPSHRSLKERHTLGVADYKQENGDNLTGGEAEIKPTKKWVWFSADLRYFRELGFQAAFWQLVAATIFWISGFTAIPTIQTSISEDTPLLNGAFWTPQVIGGSGFIISSTFIMLEAQKTWWKPAFWTIGWQVGIWNFIGAMGFTLCGIFGYFAQENHGLAYQSSLCTFWGGWAFLIGSVFQWYESVNPI